MLRSASLALALLACGAAVVGCGDSGTPPPSAAHQVTGRVTIDGAPASDLEVSIRREDVVPAPLVTSSRTDAEGRYSLAFTSESGGAYDVVLSVPLELQEEVAWPYLRQRLEILARDRHVVDFAGTRSPDAGAPDAGTPGDDDAGTTGEPDAGSPDAGEPAISIYCFVFAEDLGSAEHGFYLDAAGRGEGESGPVTWVTEITEPSTRVADFAPGVGAPDATCEAGTVGGAVALREQTTPAFIGRVPSCFAPGDRLILQSASAPACSQTQEDFSLSVILPDSGDWDRPQSGWIDLGTFTRGDLDGSGRLVIPIPESLPTL